MSKHIISQYLITIYNDGSITTKEFNPRNVTYDCPESIKQIAGIVQKAVISISDRMTGSDFDEENFVPKTITFKCVTQAIADVAAEFNVTISTVHTKITRYLEMSMDDFKKLCAQYYYHLIMGEEGEPDMIKELTSIISQKCKDDYEKAESIGCIKQMHERILDAGHRPMNELEDF